MRTRSPAIGGRARGGRRCPSPHAAALLPGRACAAPGPRSSPRAAGHLSGCRRRCPRQPGHVDDLVDGGEHLLLHRHRGGPAVRAGVALAAAGGLRLRATRRCGQRRQSRRTPSPARRSAGRAVPSSGSTRSTGRCTRRPQSPRPLGGAGQGRSAIWYADRPVPEGDAAVGEIRGQRDAFVHRTHCLVPAGAPTSGRSVMNRDSWLASCRAFIPLVAAVYVQVRVLLRLSGRAGGGGGVLGGEVVTKRGSPRAAAGSRAR